MRCIFCLEERPPSVEHVFPGAIGGTLKIDRVCKPCNEWLGANVDVPLTDETFVILKRAELGMRCPDGKPVDPWTSVFRDGTLANDPDQRIKITSDPVTGKLRAEAIYKVVRTKRDDGADDVRVTLDASKADEIGKIIQRERKRAGAAPLPDHELKALVASVREQMGSIERPEVIFTPSFDLSRYRKGIFKIIYELAWFWLGDDYLADPIAQQLRNAILLGSEELFRGVVALCEANSPFAPWNGEPKAHIAMSYRNDAHLVISIRIFDLAFGAVVVTENPNRYPLARQNQFLLMGLEEGAGSRQSTVEQELCRMLKRPGRL